MKKILLILSITGLALTARGNSIVFNTLGPGDTYDQSNGFDVIAPFPGFTEDVAAQFVALASGNLATVDLGLTRGLNSPPGPVNVYLYGDASGSPNNSDQTFLGSGTATAVFGTTNNSLVSFAVAGTIPVTMGTTYWLVLKPVLGTFDIWNASEPPVLGNFAFSVNDSPWIVGTGSPAFRITAIAATGVPDSGATFLLLLSSAALLLGLHRISPREQASR
jgi:hypothetical protein